MVMYTSEQAAEFMRLTEKLGYDYRCLLNAADHSKSLDDLHRVNRMAAGILHAIEAYKKNVPEELQGILDVPPSLIERICNALIKKNIHHMQLKSQTVQGKREQAAPHKVNVPLGVNISSGTFYNY